MLFVPNPATYSSFFSFSCHCHDLLVFCNRDNKRCQWIILNRFFFFSFRLMTSASQYCQQRMWLRLSVFVHFFFRSRCCCRCSTSCWSFCHSTDPLIVLYIIHISFFSFFFVELRWFSINFDYPNWHRTATRSPEQTNVLIVFVFPSTLLFLDLHFTLPLFPSSYFTSLIFCVFDCVLACRRHLTRLCPISRNRPLQLDHRMRDGERFTW